MSNTEKLLSISSEALGETPSACPEIFRGYELGPELLGMLEQKNGFYAFEYALHVFPLTSDPESGLEGRNADSLWRKGYEDFAEGLLFFAEDILQDQFCLSRKQGGVYRFHAETAQTTFMAASVEEFPTMAICHFAGQVIRRLTQAMWSSWQKGQTSLTSMIFRSLKTPWADCLLNTGD